MAHTKSGKSCGTDGAPYEFWCAALQSDSAEQHLIEFLNDVLFGNQDFPQAWLLSHVVSPSEGEGTETSQGLSSCCASCHAEQNLYKGVIIALEGVFPCYDYWTMGVFPSCLQVGQLDIQAAFGSLRHDTQDKKTILAYQYGSPAMYMCWEAALLTMLSLQLYWPASWPPCLLRFRQDLLRMRTCRLHQCCNHTPRRPGQAYSGLRSAGQRYRKPLQMALRYCPSPQLPGFGAFSMSGKRWTATTKPHRSLVPQGLLGGVSVPTEPSQDNAEIPSEKLSPAAHRCQHRWFCA